MLPNEPLNLDVFGRLAALEAEAPGFLAELVEEFNSAVVRRLAAMVEAHGAQDEEALVFAAHGMRGSCGMVGAMRMVALAHRLEYGHATRAEQWALVGRLQTEYGEVRPRLSDAVVGAALAASPS